MAKSKSEMMREMRAKRKCLGLKELRIYAPEDLHPVIQQYVSKLLKRENVNMEKTLVKMASLSEDQKDGLSCCVCGGGDGQMKPLNNGDFTLFVCCRHPNEVEVN
jgi:hypothetical protein